MVEIKPHDTIVRQRGKYNPWIVGFVTMTHKKLYVTIIHIVENLRI